jgi:hypothetical protein
MPPATKKPTTEPRTEHATLGAALAAFQGEMPTVHKGKTAKVPTKTGGSYSYSYADVADVTAAVMPLLSRHGLSFTCLPRATESGYELVARLLHGVSGESVEGALPLYGRTSQEIGSAITYNRRYLLGCLTGVVTDDDEDGAAATRTDQRTAHAPRERRLTDEEIREQADSATSLASLKAVWDRNDVASRSTAVQDYIAVRKAELEGKRTDGAAAMAAAMGGSAEEMQ